MTGSDAILDRIERLEREVAAQRRRAGAWRLAAVGAVHAVVAFPLATDAANTQTSLGLRSAYGRAEAQFTTVGFEYKLDGQPRVKFDVSTRLGASAAGGHLSQPNAVA